MSMCNPDEPAGESGRGIDATPRNGAFSWARALPLALTLSFSVAVVGCSRKEPEPEPIRSVKLMTVGAAPLHAQLEYSAEVRARVESRLGFRVPGKIVERQAELGQKVKAGQLLAQLDARDYQLSAQAAQAQVNAAKTQRDLAAADFQRYSKLKEQSFISGAELERREASLKAAQASLDQASAQLASQGNQASYTRLVADVSGVITGIDAEPGQVVAAGASVVRIAQDGARDAVFSVPEDKVAQVRAGQPVAIRPWAEGANLKGTVREVAASADPVTRTFLVKVAIEGAQVPPLGATVYVEPSALGREGVVALTVPTTALRQEGGQTAVWIYDAASGTVRSQAVQVATADGNQAVIAGGIQPGMQIVATGVHVLSPGQKVTVYQPKGSKQDAATPAAAAPATAASGN
ncbi:efflux RND transporter periplasmic adaptor subunit [Diaphorobacter ruginosibacter]|uniref:Efflux RND transporter periplasmic adaptor subunit n=1 Tax=Diaphorobacter ruginosibacter TaxID=1715720 RepID=A0A7G9RKL8_9BURK|nr:efflux RND transporter periplasmic adaptor subunit [Diaphorobacter ruginosibacter]QNN56143.1 efflux RND transporter periplasmic adaptor subunit [Diaphorobacter ruginosibacter]